MFRDWALDGFIVTHFLTFVLKSADGLPSNTYLNECQSWQWILLTRNHDNGIACRNGCPKKRYHGEEGILVREDNPHNSQGFGEGQSRAGLWHRLKKMDTTRCQPLFTNLPDHHLICSFCIILQKASPELHLGLCRSKPPNHWAWLCRAPPPSQPRPLKDRSGRWLTQLCPASLPPDP